MATPITRKQLLDLLRPGIDELFLKEYAEINTQTYITEVDFGHNKLEGTRRSTHKVRSTPSGSDGSN